MSWLITVAYYLFGGLAMALVGTGIYGLFGGWQ
jgi:hypothetical protein